MRSRFVENVCDPLNKKVEDPSIEYKRTDM